MPIYVPGKVVLAQDYIAVDPDFGSVSLLLHGDGTNGSTIITDSSPSPKTLTAVGDAKISTAQSKFGGASILLDGNGDYISVANTNDLDLRTGNFTIETWTWKSANGVGGYDNLISVGNGANNFIEVSSTRGITLATADGQLLTASATVNNSTWHHVAICRSGSTYSIFFNGILTASGTPSGGFDFRTNVRIGINGSSYSFNGYIDDLRITKGVARYAGNFTPPTAPFPDMVSR